MFTIDLLEPAYLVQVWGVVNNLKVCSVLVIALLFAMPSYIAPFSKEAWLHQPNTIYSNVTYMLWG